MGLSDGTLRVDLDESATRFELLSASASPHMQFIVWVTWSALAGVVGILTLTFFLGILSSPKVRGRSFNVYVLFISFPDMFFSICCSVTCGLNAASGQYYSERGCSFQTFYTIFAFTANAWLNAVIVRQVHTMLRSSHQRRRYKPPPIKVVCGHAAIVYSYAVFIASMTLWGTSLHQHTDARGLACLPIEHNLQSSLFFWLCYFWLLMGIPLVYVAYVMFDVKRRGLLPPGGRTRSVAIFFARITFVFVLMWFPTMVAMYMANRLTGLWFGFVGGCLSHLQPIVSAGVACMKKDIGEAVLNFVTCRWCSPVDENDDDANRRDAPSPTRTVRTDTSGRLNRARRSSVFNSFLSWNNTSFIASSRSSLAKASDGPRKAEGKTALPPIISSSSAIISSSGMTSEAVASLQEQDMFTPEENAVPVEEEEEGEDGDETPRDDNV